jgi:hypothetical protein
MRDQVEFSAAIHRAMQDKISTAKVWHNWASALSWRTRSCAATWLPSGHLKKQMIEVLGIEPARVKRVVARRQMKTKAAMNRDVRTNKAT